jgi:hypothetical protein
MAEKRAKYRRGEAGIKRQYLKSTVKCSDPVRKENCHDINIILKFFQIKRKNLITESQKRNKIFSKINYKYNEIGKCA